MCFCALALTSSQPNGLSKSPPANRYWRMAENLAQTPAGYYTILLSIWRMRKSSRCTRYSECMHVHAGHVITQLNAGTRTMLETIYIPHRARVLGKPQIAYGLCAKCQVSCVCLCVSVCGEWHTLLPYKWTWVGVCVSVCTRSVRDNSRLASLCTQ